MDSYVTLKGAATNLPTKNNVIKKIVAPGVSNKVTDEETLRKRRLRFAADVLFDCTVPCKKETNEVLTNRQMRFTVDVAKESPSPRKKETNEVLTNRQMRFTVNVPKESPSKQREDILSTLKKRKERFGEITSTLLKRIEEKERVLKRKAKFAPHIERIIQNDGKKKILKCENTCNRSTVEQVNRKRTYKRITFEDNGA